MSVVLVINSGSSSLKYSLMDMEREVPLGEGLIERIGQENSDRVMTAVTASAQARLVRQVSGRWSSESMSARLSATVRVGLCVRHGSAEWLSAPRTFGG